MGLHRTARIVLLLLLWTPQKTGQITLAWDAPQDGGLTVGYHVGFGTSSRTYPTPITVGLITEFTVYGLALGQEYYFAVRAYSATGEVSVWSDEVAGKPRRRTPTERLFQ